MKANVRRSPTFERTSITGGPLDRPTYVAHRHTTRPSTLYIRVRARSLPERFEATRTVCAHGATALPGCTDVLPRRRFAPSCHRAMSVRLPRCSPVVIPTQRNLRKQRARERIARGIRQ